MAFSVMVVDDDGPFRGLARRIIDDCGYRTEDEADSVSDAVVRATHRMPDVVVADVGLPDGDGLELTRRLKALSSVVRVLLVSADSDAASQDEARDAGALAFVPKSALDCAVLHSVLNAE